MCHIRYGLDTILARNLPKADAQYERAFDSSNSLSSCLARVRSFGGHFGADLATLVVRLRSASLPAVLLGIV